MRLILTVCAALALLLVALGGLLVFAAGLWRALLDTLDEGDR